MISNVKIAGTGVATLDIYINKGRMYPGGNEFNVVCHAHEIGAQAGFLGVFGDDHAGEILENELKRLDIDITKCRHEVGTSGYSLVSIDENGDRDFLFWNEEGVTDLMPFAFTEDEIEYIKKYNVLCLGRLADVSPEKVKHLFVNGVSMCYDFHEVFDSETIASIAPYVDYGFFSCSHLNDDEIKQYLKEACDHGIKLAVGTSGCEPVWAYDGVTYYKQETLRVDPIDTLGAGDSFIAAVMVNYLSCIGDGMEHTEAVREALVKGTEYSAKVVMIEGSMGVGYDVDAETEDLIHRHGY